MISPRPSFMLVGSRFLERSNSSTASRAVPAFCAGRGVGGLLLLGAAELGEQEGGTRPSR
jgi:hypothetical protein